ncbi:MAG TPA: CAP domain-containing protein [Solirubrobacteraceae bacterium]|nr:CAP domain-containing protein [Solirubrobacteraceae bacterium]
MSTARPWLAAATMLSAAVCALAAPTAASADTTTCANAALTPAIGATAPVQQAVVCLLNVQRAAAGLPALSDAPLLDAAAGAYAQKMVAEDFFDHVSPDGSTLASRLAAVGYDYGAAGEDIGYGTGTDATAAAMVAAWMASAEHRANILEPAFAEVGVGVAPGAPGLASGATYVADFGTRASGGSGAAAPAASTATAAPRTSHRRTRAKRCTRRRAHRHLCRMPHRRHRTRTA